MVGTGLVVLGATLCPEVWAGIIQGGCAVAAAFIGGGMVLYAASKIKAAVEINVRNNKHQRILDTYAMYKRATASLIYSRACYDVPRDSLFNAPEVWGAMSKHETDQWNGYWNALMDLSMYLPDAQRNLIVSFHAAWDAWVAASKDLCTLLNTDIYNPAKVNQPQRKYATSADLLALATARNLTVDEVLPAYLALNRVNMCRGKFA